MLTLFLLFVSSLTNNILKAKTPTNYNRNHALHPSQGKLQDL